jgi:DNA-binding response OmpR family regulator
LQRELRLRGGESRLKPLLRGSAGTGRVSAARFKLAGVSSGARTFRFGDCEVDPALRQVRRNGRTAEPQPKALDLLLYQGDAKHRSRRRS